MKIAAIPDNESARLEALRRYDILDTEAEAVFDDFTDLAAQICNSPFSRVSVVNENRHWFKARRELNVGETTRDLGFCAYVLLQPDDSLIIPGARTVDTVPVSFSKPSMREQPMKRTRKWFWYLSGDRLQRLER